MTKHRIQARDVQRIWQWFQTRGGIAIWSSVNISDPTMTWTTPLRNSDGRPTLKPSWQSSTEPTRIITDPSEVLVDVPKEVRRFHVGVRRGDQGLTYKVTDGGSRRIKAAVANAGDNAWYEFDYSTQEAVILVPSDDSKTLVEYMGALCQQPK
jgi:hypothetical protein